MATPDTQVTEHLPAAISSTLPVPRNPGDSILQKSREAIYSSPSKGRITHMMHRAYNLMLKHAALMGPEHDWYTIHTAVLARDLNYNSNDMAHLEASLDRMQGTLLKWEVRDPDSPLVIKTSVQLIGKIQFIAEKSPSGACIQRLIRYRFDEEIKARLLNPKRFASLDLSLLNRFSSRYASVLFEIFMDTLTNDQPHDDGWAYTDTLPWESWRDILVGDTAASSTHFAQFKYFKRDIINKGMKNIDAVAPEIIAEALYRKSGRFITHIQFRVRFSGQQLLALDDLDIGPPIDTGALIERLRSIHVPQNVIDRSVKKYSLDDLEAATAYTEARLSKNAGLGPVDNIGAYFTNALVNRYWEATVIESTKPKASRTTSQNTLLQRTPKQDKPAKDPYVLLGETHYNSLSAEARTTQFNEYLVDAAPQSVIREYRRTGMSILVKKAFFSWLGKHLSSP